MTSMVALMIFIAHSLTAYSCAGSQPYCKHLLLRETLPIMAANCPYREVHEVQGVTRGRYIYANGYSCPSVRCVGHNSAVRNGSVLLILTMFTLCVDMTP